MVTRIATASNLNNIVSLMLNQQTQVNNLQQQVSTGYNTQDYAGVASQSAQLLSLENQTTRTQNYIDNNNSVLTTLNIQSTAVQAITSTATDMQKALLSFTSTDLTGGSPMKQTDVQDIQTQAFNALSQISYYLNQQANGSYIFGGGKNDTPPVSFPYSSLAQFQETYDGVSRVFPSTRVADLSDISFNNQNVTYGTQSFNGTTVGQITGPAADSFDSQTLTSSGFGSLIFSNAGSNGKIASTSPGAFSSLQVGQTILINNTSPGQGGTTDNNGVYTITDVAPDGSSITLDQNVNAGTEPAGSDEIKLAPPNGTALALTGSSAGNNGAYTVTWPTNAELTAAGFNLSAGDIVDGDTLFTNPPQVSSAPETISLNSTAFLTGSSLPITQKISDTQSIDLNVTAQDPAFEKLIRGLGMLAQGNLINNPSIATQALSLVNDSIEHSTLDTTELPSDLDGIADNVALNVKQLTDTGTQQNQFLTFLQNQTDTIDKADPTQTAVRLNAQAQSLQVSYATLARISSLSLLNYI